MAIQRNPTQLDGKTVHYLVMMEKSLITTSVLASLLFLGCSEKPSDPESALRSLESAAREGDRKAFRHHLTQETLQSIDHANDKGMDVDRLIMDLIRLDAPLTVVDRRTTGSAVTLVAAGVGPSKDDFRFRFVREDGQWKADLKQDMEAWVQLARHVNETTKRMEESAPLPGVDGSR